MNFERGQNPIKNLQIGIKFLKKQKIQSLLDTKSFGFGVTLGMGEIIELIIKNKDIQIIEIFMESFLNYFLCPIRKGEEYRWIPVLENLPNFPKEHQIKIRDMVLEIHDKISML